MGVRVPDEAARDDLGHHLGGEDVQEDGLGLVDELGLPRAAWVQRRLPRQLEAIERCQSRIRTCAPSRRLEPYWLLVRMVRIPSSDGARIIIRFTH